MVARILLFVTLLGLPSVRGQQEPEGDPPFDIVGLSFFAVQVSDDVAAAHWYRRAFGLKELRHIEAEDGRYSIRILSRAGLTVEVIRLRSASQAPHPRTGLFKAGFYVDDIDAAHAWLAQLGVDVDERIFDDETVKARSFVLRDLEENRLQIFQK